MKRFQGVALFSAAIALAAVAQNAPPAPPPATPPPATPAPTAKPATPPDDEPTLDDLLGLKRPQDQPDAGKADDPSKTELDRKLADESIDEEFAQAVDLMGRSAQRLADAKDTGIDTQRLQAEAILRLDKLIADAQKQSQQSRQRSKPQQQDPSEQRPQDQQQSSQSSPQQAQGSQPGDSSVPQRDGRTNAPRTGASASWGNLPDHVRQSLMQGRSDRFSSIYRQLTEQYYRRLAEEPRPVGGQR